MIVSYQMPGSAKVAFSLDPALLERVERIRARTGESRSALIARALMLVAKQEARQEKIARYVQAYREQPETSEDEARARHVARRTLARLRWDAG